MAEAIVLGFEISFHLLICKGTVAFLHVWIFPLFQSKQGVRITCQHFAVAPGRLRWRETLLTNKI